MSQPANVWIIDDDQSIRWVLERALSQAGMNTRVFENGEGIMARLERERPDAIISDIRMPGVDGITLLSQVVEQYTDVPVIIMTAHSDLDSAVTSYQTGAFEYLPKPFDVGPWPSVPWLMPTKNGPPANRPPNTPNATPRSLAKHRPCRKCFGPLAGSRTPTSPC